MESPYQEKRGLCGYQEDIIVLDVDQSFLVSSSSINYKKLSFRYAALEKTIVADFRDGFQ